MSEATKEAYFPPLALDEDLEFTASDNMSKSAMVGELIWELLLYAGELIIPILMWSCIIAILAGFIQRSNWNFTTRMTFYAIIAAMCLIFLLVRHGANHVITARLKNL